MNSVRHYVVIVQLSLFFFFFLHFVKMRKIMVNFRNMFKIGNTDFQP